MTVSWAYFLMGFVDVICAYVVFIYFYRYAFGHALLYVLWMCHVHLISGYVL